jgi:hypothetical protein
MLTQVHFLQCFEEQNVCRASIVYQNFSDNPSNYVHFDDHGIIVIHVFQLEILLCESDWHLGPLWSGSWTVVDDGVFLCFLVSNSMVDPTEIGMIVPKEGNAFEF